MNSSCAAAVLVLPVQSLLPPCMPPLKGGVPLLMLCDGISSSSSQTPLCFNAGLLLPCTFLTPAPFLGSLFLSICWVIIIIFFCKFLFERFAIVNKENKTF